MNKDIEKYLEFLKFEKNLSDNTIKSYQNDLEEFSKFFSCDLLKLRKSDVQNFLYKLKKSSKTKAHYLTVINSFYKFYIQEEVISINPVVGIKMPKLSKTIPNYLSYEEIDLLLDIPLKNAYDYRNKAALELMYSSGLRISELLSLKVKNIDFEGCLVKVLGKGNKERLVPINEVALKYLRIYISDYRDKLLKKEKCEFVFINNLGKGMSRVGFFKIIKQRALEIGIKKEVSPHILRHSFATHLVNNGADIRIVQELLGHKNLVTTEIYAHVMNAKVINEYQSHPHAKK